MVGTQPQVMERFKQMYGVDPTSKDAQEVVRQTLVRAYDAYKNHEVKVMMAESHPGDPYYKSPFPNWPWDAIQINEQKLGQIDKLIAAAQPFFPDMNLEFFANEAGNPRHSARSNQLLQREDLTPQQKYLLSGKKE